MDQLARSRDAAQRAGFDFRHVPETGSTNDDLAGEAREGTASSAVLVADHQRAGRGRAGRRWRDQQQASLLVSIRMETPAAGGFAAVGAVTAAFRNAAAGFVDVPVLAKWPNDLVIEDERASGKLAGVLAELVTGPPSAIVVGVGMNVGAVPHEPGAISLAEAGSSANRDDVLGAMLDCLPGLLAHPEEAQRDLRAASATIGRRVRVELADGDEIVGRARAIDPTGRLVVATPQGDQVVDVGDVYHLRSGS